VVMAQCTIDNLLRMEVKAGLVELKPGDMLIMGMGRWVGRVTPCAPFACGRTRTGAHGVTRPTIQAKRESLGKAFLFIALTAFASLILATLTKGEPQPERVRPPRRPKATGVRKIPGAKGSRRATERAPQRGRGLPASRPALQPAALRSAAETRLRKESTAHLPDAQTDPRRLLHELQVHQIELEMQNSELRRVKAELDSSLEEFTELYDLAPACYLTLRRDGTIQRANLAAASLLGRDRSDLRERRFALFIAASSRAAFDALLSEAFGGKSTGFGELPLVVKAKPPLTVQLRASVSDDGRECRVVLTDFTEIRRIERGLVESDERYRGLFEAASDAVLMVDQETGEILDANAAALKLYGYTREEILTLKTTDVSAEPDLTRQAISSGVTFALLRWHRRKDRTVFPVEISGSYFHIQGRPAHVGIIRDITERKRLEEERELSLGLLDRINSSSDLRTLMQETTRLLRDGTGCEAVGVRLRDGEDFPYFETTGFPPEFVRAENALCALDPQGKIVRNPQGDPVLECMCGNILCGRFNPAKPFFTAQGSFWTNCTTELLATTTDADRQARTRNRCNGMGYESVALIRLRSTCGTFGLLQFNDKRRGRFTPAKIAFLERMADHLATALARWQAEEACRRSDESLRLGAEAARFGTYTYDFASGTGRWSPEFKALLGLKPGEALTLDADLLFVGIHPEDRAAFLAAMTAANDPRGDGVLDAEYRVLRPDGSVRWLNVRGSTSFAGDGAARHPERAAGVLLDITERKRAEASLREVEARLHLAVQAADIGLWNWDLKTDKVYYSSEWKRQLGYRDDEVSNGFEEWQNRLHPDDIEWSMQRVRAYLVNPQGAHEIEVRMRHKDGSYRWIYARAKVLRDDGGKSVQMLGCHVDITERKRVEQELMASRGQLRALAGRMEMVREEERTRIAREIHDVLAQELARLKMDVVWLHRRLGAPLDPKQQEGLRERLTVMAGLTDTAMQAVLKISTELRPMILDALGLGPAVEWQVQDFQARTEIACAVTVPEQDVTLDRTRSTAMFRILQESLTNVLRHAQATRVEVFLELVAGQLILRIHDNGCGISPAALSSDRSIGLVGMRERALLLAGAFDIRSHPRTGTTVEVRFPLSSPPDLEKGAP